MTEPRKKLLVVITATATNDKATIAFTIANASLSEGMDVTVFVTSDGVDLARAGSAETAQFSPFKPLSELVDSFVENGGKLLACGSCWNHRGMKDLPVAEGMTIAGVASVVELLAAGATTLTF